MRAGVLWRSRPTSSTVERPKLAVVERTRNPASTASAFSATSSCSWDRSLTSCFLTFRKHEVKDLSQLQELVAENAEAVEAGLRVLTTAVNFRRSTVARLHC